MLILIIIITKIIIIVIIKVLFSAGKGYKVIDPNAT